MATYARRARSARVDRVFYRAVLPSLIGVNLILGCFLLGLLRPGTWLQWLELGTGAFCCVLSGWLMGAWWSRHFWRSSIASQLSTWQRVIDELFAWIEELRVEPDDLSRLRRTVDRIITTR